MMSRNMPLRNLLAMFLVLAAGCGPGVPDERLADERFSPVRAMAEVDVAGYERAIEPRAFVFPEDHGPHPGFKLEWWYFVGNLSTVGSASDPPSGRRFGFQLTFFRQALAPDPAPDPSQRASSWASRDLYMAHFALTDVDGERFTSWERFSRAAAGLAGARAVPFEVWVDGWRVESAGESFLPLRLRAREGDVAIDLALDSSKPLVLQGEEGLSRKSPEPGNASYYYSFTRLEAAGTVTRGDDSRRVEGTAWLDREWSTSGLEEDQVGWDWFALQLDDGRDLMVYQLRRAGGSIEPLSHGSLVAADGSKRLLRSSDFELEVLRTWTSPRGGEYPAGWRLRLPGAGLDLEIEPLLADQELDTTFRYWEGAVAVRGRGGSPAGRGYVELVGYGDR